MLNPSWIFWSMTGLPPPPSDPLVTASEVHKAKSPLPETIVARGRGIMQSCHACHNQQQSTIIFLCMMFRIRYFICQRLLLTQQTCLVRMVIDRAFQYFIRESIMKRGFCPKILWVHNTLRAPTGQILWVHGHPRHPWFLRLWAQDVLRHQYDFFR